MIFVRISQTADYPRAANTYKFSQLHDLRTQTDPPRLAPGRAPPLWTTRQQMSTNTTKQHLIKPWRSSFFATDFIQVPSTMRSCFIFASLFPFYFLSFQNLVISLSFAPFSSAKLRRLRQSCSKFCALAIVAVGKLPGRRLKNN